MYLDAVRPSVWTMMCHFFSILSRVCVYRYLLLPEQADMMLELRFKHARCKPCYHLSSRHIAATTSWSQQLLGAFPLLSDCEII